MLNLIYWKTVGKRFWQDHCLTQAQALTYATLFALIPLLALVFAIARLFIQAEDIMSRAETLLSQFLNPAALESVQETLFGLLKKAQEAPLGKASMLIFLFMILGLLMQTEGVLNQIFRVRKGRNIPQKITVYWMGITLGPVLLLLPLIGSIYLSHFAGRFSFLSWTLRGLHIFTVIFFFIGLYFYLPGRKVKLQAAFFGGLVAGLLWVLTAYLYTLYTAKAVAYSKLYGSLAAFPLFLLWLFLSWAVTLFGAEAAAVYEEKEWLANGYEVPKPLLALAIALELGRAYEKGEAPLEIFELSQKLNTSPALIEEVLEILEEKSLILRTEGGFLLARDMVTIKIKSIVSPFMGELPGEPPAEESLQKAYFSFKTLEKFLEKTLAELKS